MGTTCPDDRASKRTSRRFPLGIPDSEKVFVSQKRVSGFPEKCADLRETSGEVQGTCWPHHWDVPHRNICLAPLAVALGNGCGVPAFVWDAPGFRCTHGPLGLWANPPLTGVSRRAGSLRARNVSTSDFQSEVGEVFGEIGGELPAKLGRRFSSFICWGENRQKHFLEEDQKGYPQKGYPWKGRISPILGHFIQ